MPYILVGWLWFLGTIIPVIGLVQIGSASMADRYTYIPLIGIFITFAFSLEELCRRFHWPEKIFSVFTISILIACIMLTERQLPHWQDGETLFRHAIAVTKDNEMAHCNLGLALELQGRYDEALAEYCEAVTINPYHHEFHFSIGKMLEKLGRAPAALDEYRQCLALKPNNPALHNAAGSALAARKFPEALAEFDEAKRLDTRITRCLTLASPKFSSSKASTPMPWRNYGRPCGLSRITIEMLSAVAHIFAASQNDGVRDGQSALVLASQGE